MCVLLKVLLNVLLNVFESVFEGFVDGLIEGVVQGFVEGLAECFFCLKLPLQGLATASKTLTLYSSQHLAT